MSNTTTGAWIYARCIFGGFQQECFFLENCDQHVPKISNENENLVVKKNDE